MDTIDSESRSIRLRLLPSSCKLKRDANSCSPTISPSSLTIARFQTSLMSYFQSRQPSFLQKLEEEIPSVPQARQYAFAARDISANDVGYAGPSVSREPQFEPPLPQHPTFLVRRIVNELHRTTLTRYMLATFCGNIVHPAVCGGRAILPLFPGLPTNDSPVIHGWRHLPPRPADTPTPANGQPTPCQVYGCIW